jgi:hypothetical protein
MSEPQQEPGPYDVIKVPRQTDHVHTWDILDVWRQSERQYHPQIQPRPITVVLVKCKTCELPQTIELQGVWSLEQLLKSHARIEHREK